MKKEKLYAALKFVLFFICMVPIACMLCCLAGVGSLLDWFLKRKEKACQIEAADF